MKPRANPLPEPAHRLPYLSVIVGGETLWLRVPSLLTIAQIGKVLDRPAVAPVAAIGAALLSGQSFTSALGALQAGGEGVVQIVGALIGISWADPRIELSTARPTTWTREGLAAFGAGVWEELHEAGWTLGQIVGASLALSEQIQRQSRIEEEVLEKARFFGLPRDTTTTARSTSNAPSSVPSTGGGSRSSRAKRRSASSRSGK